MVQQAVCGLFKATANPAIGKSKRADFTALGDKLLDCEERFVLKYGKVDSSLWTDARKKDEEWRKGLKEGDAVDAYLPTANIW